MGEGVGVSPATAPPNLRGVVMFPFALQALLAALLVAPMFVGFRSQTLADYRAKVRISTPAPI